MKKLIITTIYLMLISFSYVYAEQQNVSVDIIESNRVMDEWCEPGLYSPVNILDGDINTWFAEGEPDRYYNRGYAKVKIYFSRPVLIDEVHIINGCAKDKRFFLKNSRLKNIKMSFSNNDKVRKNKECSYVCFDNIKYLLKDTSEIQKIQIGYTLLSDEFILTNEGNEGDQIYPGEAEGRSCITEVEFYYKGEKITINNLDKLRKDYNRNIGIQLQKIFTTRIETGGSYKSLPNIFYVMNKYDIKNNCSGECPQEYENDIIALLRSHIYLDIKKDGSIYYKKTGAGYVPPVTNPNDFVRTYLNKDQSDYFPDGVMIKDSKLYMKFKEKWILCKYWFTTGGVIVETQFDKTLPNNFYLYFGDYDIDTLQ